MKPIKRNGFTLIEILVVTLILAILLAIVVLAINIPKQMIAARDLQRKMDVKHLAEGISAYFTSNKAIPDQDQWISFTCNSSNLPNYIEPFIGSFPCDPKSGDRYYYEPLDTNCQPCIGSSCVKFRILTTLENPKDFSITIAGCQQDIGCGPINLSGQPYNYGASLSCPLMSDGLTWKSPQAALQAGLVSVPGKILEVGVSLNTSPASQPVLTRLTQKTGYFQTTSYKNPQYKIALFDAEDRQIFFTDFSLSSQDIYTDFKDDTQSPSKIQSVLTLPWSDQIQTVAILDINNTKITSLPISKMTVENNSPSYITIPGSSVLPKTNTLNFNFFPSAKASGDNGHINFVFIGDGFSTPAALTLFHEQVNKYIKHMLTYEPFKSRASEVLFHYIDNTQALGCSNLWSCMSKVANIVNTAGVPWDTIYVVENSTCCGGSAVPPYAEGSMGDWGPQIFVHENSHSFAYISDEYIANNPNEGSDLNCYSGIPPNPAWAGIVPTDSYFLGCNYSNWYRSSASSVMHNGLAPYYNPITQKYVNDEINRRLGTQVVPTLIPAPTPTPTIPVPTPVPHTPYTIGGNLTDCETNAPIANATIKFDSYGTSYGGTKTAYTTTNSQGHFTYSGWMTPLYYGVRPASLPAGYNNPASTTVEENTRQYACITLTNNNPLGSLGYDCQAAGNSDCSGPDSSGKTERCNLCYHSIYSTTPTPTFIPTPTPQTKVSIQGHFKNSADADLTMAGLGVTITGPTGTSATTSASPAWSFNDLPPGYYRVIATPITGYKIDSTFCVNCNLLSHAYVYGSSIGFTLPTPGNFADVYIRYSPIPTPVVCIQPWSVILGSTSLTGKAGDVLNESITITNNNPTACTGGNFAISYAVPSGYTVLNLPPSVFLAGGQSQTINFTITISTGAQIGDYLAQFWVNSGGDPYNASIHVTGTIVPPETNMFSNLSAKLYGDYALFKFSYNAPGLGDFRIDAATDQSALNQTVGPNDNGRYGFTFSSGTPMDPSNQATPNSVRAAIQSNPQSWYKWTCGTTIYWRMYNSSDLRIASPIQTGTVDCTTHIDVLPWETWYAALYMGVYDIRYDANFDGVVDWADYWILVDQTRLR